MNISDLTKKSIQTISKNGDLITPILFFDTFCGEARRNRIMVEDCELIKNYIEKLDKEFQKEANRYNIRNIKEFLSYLTSSLNRMNQNHLAKRHHSLLDLTIKMSEVIGGIDNQKLEDLSGRTNAVLTRGHTPENIDEIKREWAKFNMSYKREINREKLGKYIAIDINDDLDSIIDKIVPILEKTDKKQTPTNPRIIDILFKSVTPSLAKLEGRDTDKLYRNLRANPEKIFDENIQTKIENLYDKRIEIDRGEETKSIHKASSLINNFVDEVESESSKPEHINIVKELDEISKDVSQISQAEKTSGFLNSLSKKLNDIGQKTSGFFGKFKAISNRVSSFQDSFQKLENDILQSRQDVDRDLLTNLRNKKGFDTDLQEIEKEFQDFQKDYSVVVIDIDGFKAIVERYGNDAGDLILRYFSKILKEYISVGDSTARVGEDKFIVSLHNRNLTSSLDLMQKFKEKVKHTKFVYKNSRVIITFSAGVTSRQNIDDFHKLIDSANKMMNEAKKLGRDRIYPESIY